MANGTQPIKVRHYGDSGAFVLVLHGGPAAPGYMKPVAETLAEKFRVLEPFQRGSSDVPLTVARHVQDLQDVITEYCGDEKPLLVGHSWGAMLALAWAAEHPDTAKAIVLVGCGTFDAAARRQMDSIRQQRMDDTFRQRLEQLPLKYPKPDVRLAVLGSMYQQLDSVDLIEVKNHLHACDAVAHEQTWADIVRLQSEGVYPAALAAIRCPALMLHGDDDPHPGTMIHNSLKPFLPQLEYVSWPHCGHYPWLEKTAQCPFYTTLTRWLKAIP
ncbi:MAG: alpha/beta fold hydrolase [Planctomycetota bacterium]|jgi:pimeloyl-ACP methyl ester carboxylesterase